MKKILPEEINPNVPGILVLSHGDMAIGMLNSAEMICGKLENVVAVSIEPTDDLDEYRATLVAAMNRFPAGALILVDLMSGTPFNTVMSIAAERQIYGIAGMNLPLLIETALMRGSSSLAEIAATAHEKIHSSICDLGDLQAELRKSSQGN